MSRSRNHHIPRFFRTLPILRACVPRGARARAAEPAERRGAGKAFRSLQVPTPSPSWSISPAPLASLKTPLVLAPKAEADRHLLHPPVPPPSPATAPTSCLAPSIPEPSLRCSHPSTQGPQSSLYSIDLSFSLAPGPRPEVGLENPLGPQLRALTSRTVRAETEAATRKGGYCTGKPGVCTLEPALPPS